MSNFKLSDYLYKYVKVVDNTGNTHTGYADMYSSAYDDPDYLEESIGIISSKGSKDGIFFYSSEIKSIEIVEG